MGAQETHGLPFIGHDLPQARTINVTPQIAEEWLTANTHNRALRLPDIARYARDMAAGNWRFTGEAVKFSREGVLLDGQHRLIAITRAQVTIPMLVVTELDMASQGVMDAGSKRTAADALSLSGQKHAALLAAAARLALMVETDDGEYARIQPSHSEIAMFVEKNPDIKTATANASTLHRRIDCRPAVIAYTMFALGRIDSEQAVQFWVDAAEKVGLSAGDPVLALTQRLSESRRQRETLALTALLSMIYRAWNARRDGKTMRLIKVRSTKGGFIPIPEPK